eukprot:scaffold312559_cov17-Prasinocladus_malaysianus.AAC.1
MRPNSAQNTQIRMYTKACRLHGNSIHPNDWTVLFCRQGRGVVTTAQYMLAMCKCITELVGKSSFAAVTSC